MGWMPRRPLLLLAGSVLLLAPLISVQLATGPGRAHACSCAPPPPDEAFEKASAVFSGRVVGISGETESAIKIQVDEVWKGSATSTTVLERPSECGYPGFTLGEDYLVYARSLDESLAVFLCSGTAQLEYAEEYWQELGEGHGALGEGHGALGEGYAPEPGDEERAAGLGMLLLAAFALAVAAILLRLAARPRRSG